jgi:LemA protein
MIANRLMVIMIVKSLDHIMDTTLASVAAFNRSGVHMRRWVRWFFLLLLSILLSACGYNSLQAGDEQIKASWAEVVNQYQRRADLVPNLVNTVKAYAAHERQVLTQVTDARARVGSMQITPDVLNDPQAFARFQAAQGQLSGALSRLLLISENYPQLKADASFRDLQAQLEGTENRITVARKRYIKAVQDYNVVVRSFPTNLTALLFGMKVKPNFTVENESAISNAPPVDFGAPASK